MVTSTVVYFATEEEKEEFEKRQNQIHAEVKNKVEEVKAVAEAKALEEAALKEAEVKEEL